VLVVIAMRDRLLGLRLQRLGAMIVTDTIDSIKNTLENIDEGTLVLFDCDDVLTTLEEHIWKRQNHEFFLEWCTENIPEGQNSLNEVANIILVTSKNFLVEGEMPEVVRSLHAKNAKAVVLTALSMKPIKEITDPLDWRVRTLKNFEYNFEKFWPSLPRKHFDEFNCEYPPAYASGVICSGKVSKGQTMEAFLKYSKVTPRKVVFIDDKAESIESVRMSCAGIGAEFIGIQYLGADRIVSQIPFSEEKVRYQLQILKEKNIWIPDAEA
jgi:hypothetical protein